MTLFRVKRDTTCDLLLLLIDLQIIDVKVRDGYLIKTVNLTTMQRNGSFLNNSTNEESQWLGPF